MITPQGQRPSIGRVIPRSQKRCPPLCWPHGSTLFLTCLLPRAPIVILARLCRFVGSAVHADHKSKSKTMVNRVGDSEGCEGLKRGPVCCSVWYHGRDVSYHSRLGPPTIVLGQVLQHGNGARRGDARPANV